jgi:hypothetical protein
MNRVIFNLESEANAVFDAAEVVEGTMANTSSAGRSWVTFKLLEEIEAFKTKWREQIGRKDGGDDESSVVPLR